MTFEKRVKRRTVTFNSATHKSTGEENKDEHMVQRAVMDGREWSRR